MSSHVVTLYGAKRLVFASATFMPTSTTSGARVVPASWLIASTSSWLLPFGLAELAQSGGRAMTLSSFSFLAAAINASMPPQSDADVADAPHDEVLEPVPPHAATTSSAATARPRPRIRYRQFIRPSPQ